MTDLLIIIRDAEEVATAVAAGADRLVVRLDRLSPATETLRGIGETAEGRCPVTLWVDGADQQPLPALTASGADQLWSGATVEAPVERWRTFTRATDAAGKGTVGLVIGAEPAARRLLATTTIGGLARQVEEARSLDLAVAIAGHLEAPDIPRLLALAPDALVCGALVCRDGVAGAPLDPQRLRLVRDLIPTHPAARPTIVPHGHDRIFVRDWTASIHLGAYGHERAAQRVRFAVEAEVERVSARAADMRDIVTYDLITDAIERATIHHVDLVETIAEDVATLILAHPRVLGVDVTVEKLDLGPGPLGCRILRRRG